MAIIENLKGRLYSNMKKLCSICMIYDSYSVPTGNTLMHIAHPTGKEVDKMMKLSH